VGSGPSLQDGLHRAQELFFLKQAWPLSLQQPDFKQFSEEFEHFFNTQFAALGSQPEIEKWPGVRSPIFLQLQAVG
jgi:hypothetical protein